MKIKQRPTNGKHGGTEEEEEEEEKPSSTRQFMYWFYEDAVKTLDVGGSAQRKREQFNNVIYI